MKPFTNTAAGRKRLLKVCNVVREGLGLGDLHCEYTFEKGDDKHLANSFTANRGWRIHITFFDCFFKCSAESQLVTVVHEHIHSMLVPLYQHSYELHDIYVPEDHQEHVWRAFSVVNEITVEHVAAPLLKLLRPQIEKVL